MRRSMVLGSGAALILGCIAILLVTIGSGETRRPEPDPAAATSEARPARSSDPMPSPDAAGNALATDSTAPAAPPPVDKAPSAPEKRAEPAADEDGLCAVRGVVLAVDGVPLRAEIHCHDVYRETGHPTESDDRGRFTLRLRPGDFRLKVRPERGRTTKCSLIIDEGAAGKSVTIHVSRGFDLRGTVLDTVTGLPIEGATVKARHRDATTDPSGHYTLVDLDPAVRLTVKAPGYNPKRDRLRLNAHTVRDFELRPAIRIEGTVVDSAGRPIPGARVRSEDVRSTTDSHGRFRLTDVAFDEQTMTARVVAEADDYVGRVWADYRIEAPSPVRLVLVRGATINGRVLDAGTKKGVAGVMVFASPRRAVGIRTTTDAAGAFTISGLRAGRCTVGPSGDSIIAVSPRREITLLEGQERLLAPFMVTHGIEVRGVVVDEAGHPAPGVDVMATFVGSPRRVARKLLGSRRDTRSDREGRFRLRALIPGPYHVDLLCVTGDYSTDYGSAARKRDPRKFLATEGTSELTFRVAKNHAGIVGRVQDAKTGRTVPDFTVHLERQTRDSRPWSRTFTGTDGRFRLRQIPGGRYRVWIVTNAKQTSDVQTVVLAYGRPAVKLTFLVESGP